MFLQEIANMRRIVNVNNIKLGGATLRGDKMVLTRDFLATTFRFLDQGGKQGEKKPIGPKMRSLVSTIMLALALVLLGACGDNAPAAPAPAATHKPKRAAEAGGADGGVAAFDAPQFVYAYNPVGKRDPFRAEDERLVTPEGEPQDKGGCTEPLCAYDLEQLKLVARGQRATPTRSRCSRTPDRVGHIVRRNTTGGQAGRQGDRHLARLHRGDRVLPDARRQE